MLESSLNENFNSSNLLVFLKFYTVFFESKLRFYELDIDQISKSDTFDLTQMAILLFQRSEVLDMKSVFSMLVH